MALAPARVRGYSPDPMAGADMMVGAVLSGRWRLTRLIGEGGMGAVFEAEEVNGDAKRAIKVLHPEFINEPQILQRFFGEAHAAQQLQHPNVAKVFEHAQAEDGSPYLIMELLSGIPLGEYVQRGNAIPTGLAAPIIFGVLQALVAAHGRNIVHRDLKPDNIFLVPDAHGRYTVKVLDFGIAKVMDVAGGMGSKTKTGMMLGTPGYMSPEQIKNAKAVDPRSDLWSVGVMFYEMLTGREAFEAPTDFAKLTAVLTQDPKPITEVAPHLTGWHNFFTRALARDPNQRFASADEMARTLLATARALAGAAPLPTAEFRSIEVQQQASTMQGERQGREGTHVSPRLPSGPSTPSVAPPVQVVAALGKNPLEATLKSGQVSPLQMRSKGLALPYVVLIGLMCFALGLSVGVAVALVAAGVI